MIDKFLTLLENPIIIIAITVIIIVVLLTQKGLVGQVLRKYLKLNTDEETAKFILELNKINYFVKDIDEAKEILKNIKNNENN